MGVEPPSRWWGAHDRAAEMERLAIDIAETLERSAASLEKMARLLQPCAARMQPATAERVQTTVARLRASARRASAKADQQRQLARTFPAAPATAHRK
jgi:hypothetical protein